MFKEDNSQQHRQHIIKNLRSNQLPRALMMTRSIIMLQKSSAQKVFYAEDWRFLNGKWYMKYAEVAVL